MTRHPLRLVRVLRTVGSAAGVALVMVGLMTQPAAAGLGGFIIGVFVAGGMVLAARRARPVLIQNAPSLPVLEGSSPAC